MIATLFSAPSSAWLIGPFAGAGLMYFIDPRLGRRRRSVMIDKINHAGHRAAAVLGKAARDAKHRLVGLGASAQRRLTRTVLDDDILAARVRTKLGRYVSHPHAITVDVRDGVVALNGPILHDEVDSLLRALQRMRGVAAIEDGLDPHRPEEHLSSLQGGTKRIGERSMLRHRSWTPSLRVGATAIGSALVLAGISGGRFGRWLIPAGGALLLRAVLDRPLATVIRGGGGEVQKTITVNASRERVYALLSDFESYPRFFAHVRRVKRLGSARLSWTLAGPASLPVRLETEITEIVPRELIALRHVADGAVVARIRLESVAEGTRIDLHLRYRMPLGVLGQAFIVSLGADPKRVLDDDFVRLKSLLERGRTRVRGEQVNLDDLQAPATS